MFVIRLLSLLMSTMPMIDDHDNIGKDKDGNNDDNNDGNNDDEEDEDRPNGVCRMVAEARTDRWPSVAAPGHPNNRTDHDHHHHREDDHEDEDHKEEIMTIRGGP